MKTMHVCALATIVGLTGCIAEDGEVYEDDVLELDEEIGEAEDELINGGGGSLGYQCTTTIDGTTCTCTDGVAKTDPQTCSGMDQHCHDKGATITCTYPPGGLYTCSCSYGMKKLGGFSYNPPPGGLKIAP
jgi:hypothetical protein